MIYIAYLLFDQWYGQDYNSKFKSTVLLPWHADALFKLACWYNEPDQALGR